MSVACPTCDLPLDANIFDVSNIFQIHTETENPQGVKEPVNLEERQTLELARFELSPEHCGHLLYFAQFTDRYANNPRSVLTPGYEWRIMRNGLPLAPWLTFEHIINPWGMSGFPLALRLEENSTVSLEIRNVDVKMRDPLRWLRRVGGRLVGHYWFADHHSGPNPLHTRRVRHSSATQVYS